MAKILRQYQSTIYGNYRVAYLKYGALIGLAVALYVWISALVGYPIKTPEFYGTDAVLAVGIFYFCYLYRKGLPNETVTLKELLLLGLGMGVAAAIVYGLLIWLMAGTLYPDWADTFRDTRLAAMPPAEESPEAKLAVETVKDYTAGDWGFIGGFRTFVISVIITFFAAIVFRTEKAPVKEKKAN